MGYLRKRLFFVPIAKTRKCTKGKGCPSHRSAQSHGNSCLPVKELPPIRIKTSKHPHIFFCQRRRLYSCRRRLYKCRRHLYERRRRQKFPPAWIQLSTAPNYASQCGKPEFLAAREKKFAWRNKAVFCFFQEICFTYRALLLPLSQ